MRHERVRDAAIGIVAPQARASGAAARERRVPRLDEPHLAAAPRVVEEADVAVADFAAHTGVKLCADTCSTASPAPTACATALRRRCDTASSARPSPRRFAPASSDRVYAENTLRLPGERFKSTTSRVVVAMNGLTPSRRAESARDLERTQVVAAMRRKHVGRVREERCVLAGTRLPPCSQLTSSRRRRRERRAFGERFAELFIDPRELGARRQRPTALPMRVASVP